MAEISDQQYQQLLDSQIGQAKYFLEEAGAFYPYGSVLDADSQIRPLGFYAESEYPEATEVHALMAMRSACCLNYDSGKQFLPCQRALQGDMNAPGLQNISDAVRPGSSARSFR